MSAILGTIFSSLVHTFSQAGSTLTMQVSAVWRSIRKNAFPIHVHELRKFIPLTSIFFMISFNYSLLRSVKDVYIMKYASVASIYYLKLFGVTPSILLLTLLYSRMSKQVNRDHRFLLTMGYFLVCFGFTYFIMPYLKFVQLDSLADSLNARMPRLEGLWQTIRYWPASLFYINAEAWGTMALGVLFWTFVNEITSIEQSKRFYSFLSIGSGIGLITAGIFLKSLKANLGIILGIIVTIVGVIAIVYQRFAADIRQHPELYQVEVKAKKKKTKLSFTESFKFLMRSQYLALIATLVICYGVAVSLFESIWKTQVNGFSDGDTGIMADIYGNQGIASGILSLIFIVFLSGPIMNRGWRFAALITPIITLVATVIFFAFVYFEESLRSFTTMGGIAPIVLAVNLGLMNIVFIKASKYTLFDPTKERAYVPLDEESKVRGKAAVDGFGSRVGKSLGSAIISLILVPAFGPIENSIYTIFFIILLMLVLWIRSVNKLSELFKTFTEE